ncbi:hypothetical protein QBC39DRAFT_237553, partial [Podospora conica]
MCYYDQIQWSCGYSRWGQFREQCDKEYRTGETCGLKLINNTTRIAGECIYCTSIPKRERALQKMADDVARWRSEGHMEAAILHTTEAMAEIQGQIAD